ncbi:MAG: PQQ-binding-like beta-propeller repeat protein [Chitinophagales bacterium]|nr:PQQ-binding-like beta-propeller repeat protein [Chitinophagales bacterium]
MEQVINKKKAIFYSSFLLLILSIFIFSCTKESSNAINSNDDNISNNPDTGLGIIGGKLWVLHNDYLDLTQKGLNTENGTEQWSNEINPNSGIYKRLHVNNNKIYGFRESIPSSGIYLLKAFSFDINTGTESEVMTFNQNYPGNKLEKYCLFGSFLYIYGSKRDSITRQYTHTISKYSLSSNVPIWTITVSPTLPLGTELSYMADIIATDDKLYCAVNYTEETDTSAREYGKIHVYNISNGGLVLTSEHHRFIGEFLYRSSKLYINTHNYEDDKTYYTCINSGNGRLVWEKNKDDFAGNNVQYSSIEGNTLVLATVNPYNRSNTKIFAVDKNNGNTLWSYNSPRYNSLVTIVNNKVYYSSDTTLYCLNGTNGSEIWKYNFQILYRSYISTVPIVADTAVFFASSGMTYALNKNTGHKIWEQAYNYTPRNILPGTRTVLLTLRDYVYFPGGIVVHK